MPFAIFSAELSINEPGTNAQMLSSAKWVLDRFFPDYTATIGYYAGRVENSFLVHLHDEEEYEHIRAIAVDFGQESVLLVDDDLTATLVMLADGQIVPVGTWTFAGTTTPPPDAKGWTCVAGMYFVCQ